MEPAPELLPGVADFVLPDGKVPVQQLSLRRNDQGQISELIIRFHPSLQAKLQSQKSVPLEFPGTGERIDVPIPSDSDFCWSQEALRQGSQHLHVKPLGLDQIRRIERFRQYVATLAE